tara:strand:+ start:643 stop:960 length:318 start_codon:yes stop_codon:yes gene_type:complete
MEQTNETKEELRKRLRLKLKSKRESRTIGITRKKSNILNDTFKNMTEILSKNNIKSVDDLTPDIIQQFSEIINEDTLKTMLSKLDNNDDFKKMLQNIQDNIYPKK